MPADTPAPWEWVRHDDGDFAYLAGDRRRILSPESAPGESAWIDVSEDDARAIEAVPELIAHLRFAVLLLRPWAGGTAQVEAMEATLAKLGVR